MSTPHSDDRMAVDAPGAAGAHADAATATATATGDSDSDEWQLLPTADGSSGGAGPRLSALMQHAPQFPRLPPHDLFVYGSESMARRRAEAEGKMARQSEVEREGRQLGAAARAAQRQKAGGHDADADAYADADAQDLSSGANLATATTPRATRRVRFGSSASEDYDGAEPNPLYDDEDEAEEDGEEDPADAVVSRATSPPDADPPSAALPHDNRAVRRGFAAAASTEEDPLYDPLADDEDEAWMRAKVQRVPFQPKRQQRKNGPGAMANAAAAAAAASAAAVAARPSPHLSCPACFTNLCYDCQRHASRPTLFRAMFVTDDVLVDKGRQVRPLPGTEDDGPDVKYWAALCRTCKTHVAVMDSDEVFHFFNVIESQS